MTLVLTPALLMSHGARAKLALFAEKENEFRVNTGGVDHNTL